MVIYFLQKGFTFTQISITASFIFIGITLFEIPTGAIADSIGRKKSVIIGFLT
jgi:MFS family permease